MILNVGKVNPFLIIIGILYYGDNERYEGEWKDNMSHGRGVLINKNRHLLL